MAGKAKAPVLYITVADQRPSGFIKQGTENTPHQEELTGPKVLWIPSEGFKARMEDGIRYNVPIRYIKNCDTIDPVEQEKRGFKPHKTGDKIKIENTNTSVTREGSEVSLYDYLSVVYYNGSAPNRPEDADKLFDEIKLDVKATHINENEFVQSDALQLVKSLQTKTKTGYIYAEERIDAICSLLNVPFSESYEQKMFQLVQRAKFDSLNFITLVTQFEQTITTEVSHALQMKVVEFDGQSAQFSEDKKVIMAFQETKLKPEQKAELLSNFLKQQDSAGVLTELRAKLEVAKNKQLSQS